MSRALDSRVKKGRKIYPYKRRVYYKLGQVVSGKKILRLVGSRGGYHYYSVECEKCGFIATLVQDALTASTGCRNCHKLKNRFPKPESRKVKYK